jgi:hypothetical protein
MLKLNKWEYIRTEHRFTYTCSCHEYSWNTARLTLSIHQLYVCNRLSYSILQMDRVIGCNLISTKFVLKVFVKNGIRQKDIWITEMDITGLHHIKGYYYFPIKTMLASSLPAVVYRSVHVLFLLFVFVCA